MLSSFSVFMPQVNNQPITQQWIEEVLSKTFNLNISARKYQNLIEVLQAQCLATKNLTNTTSFIVKNIQSSYMYQDGMYYLKDKLHENQSDLIKFSNTHIPEFLLHKASLNEKKEKRLQEKEANLNSNISIPTTIVNAVETEKIAGGNAKTIEEKKKDKPKHIAQLYGDIIDKDTYYQILDKTFLQFMVELYSQHQAVIQHNKNKKPLINQPISDYEVCSSEMRRSAIHGVVDNYQNYFKAVSDYFKNPSKYKGMPQAPKYLAKRQGKTIVIQGSSIPAGGSFVKIKSGQYLFTDYDKTTLLTEEQLSSYKEFSFNELLSQVKLRNDINEEEKPVLMRIVPKGKRIKVEVVFNTTVKTTINSVLGKTISLAKQDLYKDNTTNILSIKNKSLISIFKDKILPNCDINTLKMVGVDLGITNIAGIAYHTGQPIKGKIISNKEYEKRVRAYDIKIDNFKKNLSNKPVNEALEKSIKNRPLKLALKTKLKEFDDAHKDSKLTKIELDNLRNEIIRNNPIQTLNKQDIELLRLYNKTIYEHEKYRKLVAKKNSFVADCIHKLSHAMVQDFMRHNIEVLFIGKNDGWKNKVNMGKTTNRRFYNIPHAKLIQLLRYKCYEKGILVLTTEESYTSITSFMNNVEIKKFEDKANLENISNEEKTETAQVINLEANNPDNRTVAVKEKHNYGGKRDTKNRHNYINNTTDLKNSIDNIDNGQPTPLNGDKVKIESEIMADKKITIHANINVECENLCLNKSKLLTIHAELNGAYNMIRKIEANFKYDKNRHSRKNNIYTMFGKQSGLTKIKTKFKVRVAPKAHVDIDKVNA